MAKAIYRVEVSYTKFILGFKNADPSNTYFSNLTKAVNAIKASLYLNDWDLQGFNYSAVYRAMQLKQKFIQEFKVNGANYLIISIIQEEINPIIEKIDISKRPI